MGADQSVQDYDGKDDATNGPNLERKSSKTIVDRRKPKTKGTATVLIKCSGKSEKRNIKLSLKVKDFKRMLAASDKIRIPASEMKLVCSGRKMIDGNKPLGFYGVEDESSIHVLRHKETAAEKAAREMIEKVSLDVLKHGGSKSSGTSSTGSTGSTEGSGRARSGSTSTGSEMVDCPTCYAPFQASDIEAHFTMCRGIPAHLAVTCTFCLKRFATQGRLDRHIDSCMADIERRMKTEDCHPCPICQMSLLTSILPRHVEDCLSKQTDPDLDLIDEKGLDVKYADAKAAKNSNDDDDKSDNKSGDQNAAQDDNGWDSVDLTGDGIIEDQHGDLIVNAFDGDWLGDDVDWDPDADEEIDWGVDGVGTMAPLERKESEGKVREVKTADPSKMDEALPRCKICSGRYPKALMEMHTVLCLSQLPDTACPICFQDFETKEKLATHASQCTAQPGLTRQISSEEAREERGKIVSDEKKRADASAQETAEKLKAFFEGKSRSSRVFFNKKADGKLVFDKDPQKYDIYGEPYKAIDLSKEDFPNAQSWRGTSSSERNQLNSQGLYSSDAFRRMLTREDELCDEYICFYHSYSFPALIYEVQSCIARCVYQLDDEFAPLPRILKGPFEGKPCLDLLLEDFNTMVGQDHDPRFRALAISCNTSLLGPTSEAQPLQCFQQGYTITDLSFRAVLENVIKTCGITSNVTDICDALITIGAKYKLNVSLMGAGQSGQAGNGQTMSGHMAQIFIHKTVVDDIVYAAQPMGVLDSSRMPLGPTITGQWAKNQQVAGQARIFMHPTLFMDPSSCMIFYYPADPAIERIRPQLQLELQEALDVILGSPVAMLKAYHGIEGIKKKKLPPKSNRCTMFRRQNSSIKLLFTGKGHASDHELVASPMDTLDEVRERLCKLEDCVVDDLLFTISGAPIKEERFMEQIWKFDPVNVGQVRIVLHKKGAAGTGALKDWECIECQVVNRSHAKICYMCDAAKTKECKLLDAAPKVVLDDTPIQADPSTLKFPRGAGSGVSGGNEEWACQFCSFLNNPLLNECEMCTNKRG